MAHFFKTKRSRLKIERLKTFALLHNIKKGNNESNKNENKPVQDTNVHPEPACMRANREIDSEPLQYRDSEVNGDYVGSIGMRLDVRG